MVRAALYDGLYELVKVQAEVAQEVFFLLAAQLERYVTDGDSAAALSISRSFRLVRDCVECVCACACACACACGVRRFHIRVAAQNCLILVSLFLSSHPPSLTLAWADRPGADPGGANPSPAHHRGPGLDLVHHALSQGARRGWVVCPSGRRRRLIGGRHQSFRVLSLPLLPFVRGIVEWWHSRGVVFCFWFLVCGFVCGVWFVVVWFVVVWFVVCGCVACRLWLLVCGCE